MPIQDISNQTFSRLTAVAFSKRQGGRSLWKCVCACGNTCEVGISQLRTGHTQSCGCLKKDLQTIHGKSNTPEWFSWHDLIDRCYNPADKDYGNYGGRGITVCKRWRESFENFLADMGERPSPKHTIERKNNSEDYRPDNCKWATALEQGRNRRDNFLITVDGITLCVSEWAERVGINYYTLWSRIQKHGWTPERAVKTPTNVKHSRKHLR